MLRYIVRLGPVGTLPAQDVLTALALAEAPGWPIGLWRTGVAAVVGETVDAGALEAFARSGGAEYLVEISTAGDEPAFRLFHQALNDALRRARADLVAEARDEQALVDAFLADTAASGWSDMPAYLRRSLPTHALRASNVDQLLLTDQYLLHADLRRLLAVADQARTADGRRRARLLQLTADAADEPPATRAAAADRVNSPESITESPQVIPARVGVGAG